ncbi:retrovirus-related pol polyprotein from transposon TNT 1-94 [Tanacetum coccineum]
MTGNRRLFTSHKAYDGGHVVFGSNLKGKVVSGGNITYDFIIITNVEHVSGLAFNFISVGQLCDDDCVVSFTKVDCTISTNGKMLAKGHRRNGLYTSKLGDNSKQHICLASMVDNSTFWHRRLGHANMRLVQNLASNELVRNLQNLSFERYFCKTCGLGSQESKDDVLEKFEILCKRLENLHDCFNVSIETNHRSEFDKLQFGSFCDHGMYYNLSGPFTSQSSEIVERTHLHLTKLDPKLYGGMFLGYSQISKAYIVLNKETLRIEESLNVTFDKSLLEPKSSPSVEDDRINKPIALDLNGKPSLLVGMSMGWGGHPIPKLGYPKSVKEARGNPIEKLIGEFNERTLRLVPSCFAIFDLEPLTLSLDFVLMYEIFKSLSFRLDRLCRLAILCLDQHAYTLHHLESLLTISLDRLDILKEDNIQRISLTGFPAQSVRSSNADALDSPYLLVLNTGTSQSRQHGKSESDSYYLSD